MDEDDERGGALEDGVLDGGRGLGRTLALSDGIFAIAMTLLAFQIQPSDLKGDPEHHLIRSLGGLGDRYEVFFLSFVVIGLLWLAHHRLFNRIERAGDALMSLNLLFLMTIAALPFPSAILGQYGSQRAAVILYASSMAVAGTLLTSITLLARHQGLYMPGTTENQIRQGIWRSGSMAAVFLVSILVAIVTPSGAQFTWLILLPIRFVGTGKRRSVRRRGRTTPSGVQEASGVPGGASEATGVPEAT
jgi:uncharacterized membrane protein